AHRRAASGSATAHDRATIDGEVEGGVVPRQAREVAHPYVTVEAVLDKALPGVADRRRTGIDAGHEESFARSEPQVVAGAPSHVENGDVAAGSAPWAVAKDKTHYEVVGVARDVPSLFPEILPHRVERPRLAHSKSSRPNTAPRARGRASRRPTIHSVPRGGS